MTSFFGSAGKGITQFSSSNLKYSRFRLKNQVASVGVCVSIGEQGNKPLSSLMRLWMMLPHGRCQTQGGLSCDVCFEAWSHWG